MDLLEYQAKKLFGEVGIPVLSSQTINEPRQLKQLQIPYPIVLKSQVRVGGRGRAGGIRFVENTIDAIAAARTIFNLPILGEYPQVVLAEARYDAQREFFLAVVLDYQLKQPVLLGSSQGGMDIETLLQNLQKVAIESTFSPFHARRLAIKMGLEGELIQSTSAIIEKMYYLFIDLDLDLIEINPLGVSATGELMALDGKITVNDYALPRHPDLITLTESLNTSKGDKSPVASLLGGIVNLSTRLTSSEVSSSLETSKTKAQPRKLDWGDEKGKIGIICNSSDLALATWDLIYQEKGKPACLYLVAEEQNETLFNKNYLIEQLETALTEIIEDKKLKTILINILASPEISLTVAETIACYLQPSNEMNSDRDRDREERELIPTGMRLPTHCQSASAIDPKTIEQVNFVIRLVGGETQSIQEQLASFSIYWTDKLEEAIGQTISFAKLK
jgi:succinyl-CoA synthetase beta subunit